MDPHPAPETPIPCADPACKGLPAAFAVAALSDLLSLWLVLALPVQWGVDLLTALALFFLLGRRWALLPALAAEAVPGLYAFPFWVLTVASIAVWGRARAARPKTW